jgi:hypothetical protein
MSGLLDDDDVLDLPPELSGALTFHLPMELAALRDAGAGHDVLRARTQSRLTEAYRIGLVDPPLFRWAVERYRDTAADLVSGDAERVGRAVDDIAPLAEGLAGAAFHGLIRLGYAVWSGDAAEVARGLAYLRTRRQVLSGADGAACGNGTSLDVDLPPMEARNGVTVFDLLNVAAGTHACLDPDARSSTPRAIAAAAGALVRRNPSSFVAVHAMTGLHALCELEQLAPGGLGVWWRHLATAVRACTIVVETGPPEAVAAYDGRHGAVDDVESLVTASVRSAETHDVKLSVSLRRMVHFGVLDEREAVEIGLARLGAATLSAT